MAENFLCNAVFAGAIFVSHFHMYFIFAELNLNSIIHRVQMTLLVPSKFYL